MVNGSPSPLVSPFAGERYSDAARCSELIAPPYDVISLNQRESYKARNPHNVVRLILPDGNGDRYAEAAATLRAWRAEGVLVRDDSPTVYVLRQEFDSPDGRSYVRTGVIAGVAVEPYSSGRVRPHEKTHAGPKEDRLALLRSTRAMFEALLMMTPDRSGELMALLKDATAGDPDVRASLDAVPLAMWLVSGSKADSITAAAGREGVLYVADGHHRYETAGRYREENPAADRTLALIVPIGDPGLVVLPTHRVIHGGSIDEHAVRRGAGSWFDVSSLQSLDEAEAALAAARNRLTACVVCLPPARFLSLQLKTDVSLSDLPASGGPDAAALDIAKIDTSIVNMLVRAAGGELSYDPSIGGVVRAVESGEAAAGVFVNPTAVEQVLEVADAGAVMPQKSTYFAPKVPSGLVILGW